MNNWLRAALTAGLLAATMGSANAQGLEIRVDRGDDRYERYDRGDRYDRSDRYDRWDRRGDGPRVVQYYGDDRPRYRERRRTRTVCRTQYQRRVRANGVVVARPVQVCNRVVFR